MRDGKCRKCKVILSKDNSSPSVVRRNEGLCRICSSEHNKQRYKDNPEKYKALSVANHARNPERYKAYHKEYQKTYKPTLASKYANLKRVSEKLGRILEIDFEQYVLLVKDDACSYCSSGLSLKGYSLDRVNRLKGYTVENCVPCCRECNSIKGMIESIGFSSDRTIELLQEANQIRNSSGHRWYPQKHAEGGLIKTDRIEAAAPPS